MIKTITDNVSSPVAVEIEWSDSKKLWLATSDSCPGCIGYSNYPDSALNDLLSKFRQRNFVYNGWH